MRNALLVLLVVASALAAGCARPAATQADDPALVDNAINGTATSAGGPTANATAGGNTSCSPCPSSSAGTNATTNATVAAKNDSLSPVPPGPGWAPVDSAKVRPGMQVITPSDPRDPTATPGSARECTSNFVYTSADNKSLYLGVAAHCVSGLKVGDAADIGPGVAKGTVAYSSWYVMNNSEVPDDPAAPAGCASEKDATICGANDFALILIDPAARATVNPAMLHFGGPVGLADSGGVHQFDKVITYGNSDLRQGIEPYQEKEGYVSEPGAWTTYAWTQYPVLPGDSGSGMMTADGRALGIVVTSTLYAADPFNPPTTTGVTNLDKALSYARDHGFDARLATWALLDGGALPPV